MSYSQQQERYLAIKEALKNIKTSNGFKTTVLKVLRGIRSTEDFSGEMPGIAVYRPVTENTANKYNLTQSKMILNIWGFTKVEAKSDDFSALDDLVADVELLLMTKEYNHYFTDTFISKTSFFEGGIQDKFGFFNMEIEILFDHELTEV